jgi:hypothetical protein
VRPSSSSQGTPAPSTSTLSPPTPHSDIARPIDVLRRLSIAMPVASETPHSRATACADAPRGSAHTMYAARNHPASGTLVCAIEVPLVAENCQRHDEQQNSLRPDTRA